MTDPRRALLAKNQAYQALHKAEMAIAKRERAGRFGLAGPVPATWLARRDELAAAYDEARREAASALVGRA